MCTEVSLSVLLKKSCPGHQVHEMEIGLIWKDVGTTLELKRLRVISTLSTLWQESCQVRPGVRAAIASPDTQFNLLEISAYSSTPTAYLLSEYFT